MRTDAGPIALPRVPADAGRVLLPLARHAIAVELGRTGAAPDEPCWLREHGASFVTLMQAGKLRGCIGTLEATRELGADVRLNAAGAACRDPRFPPLAASELGDLSIEVSVLSPIEALVARAESELLKQLRPGTDGVILEYGYHRSTFLPQVWHEFPEPDVFLGRLKYKAGLPPDFWDPALKLSRYTVAKWRDDDDATR